MKLRSKYKKYRRLYEQAAILPVKQYVITKPLQLEKIAGSMIAQNWVPEELVAEDLKRKLIDHAQEIGAIIFTKEPACDPETTRYSMYMKVLLG